MYRANHTAYTHKCTMTHKQTMPHNTDKYTHKKTHKSPQTYKHKCRHVNQQTYTHHKSRFSHPHAAQRYIYTRKTIYLLSFVLQINLFQMLHLLERLQLGPQLLFLRSALLQLGSQRCHLFEGSPQALAQRLNLSTRIFQLMERMTRGPDSVVPIREDETRWLCRD